MISTAFVKIRFKKLELKKAYMGLMYRDVVRMNTGVFLSFCNSTKLTYLQQGDLTQNLWCLSQFLSRVKKSRAFQVDRNSNMDENYTRKLSKNPSEVCFDL